MTIRRRWYSLLLPLLACALLAGAPSVSAQCFGPDSLTGPCCAPTISTLPAFPDISLPGLGICWDKCLVKSTRDLKVSWVMPGTGLCSEYSTVLTVSDAVTGVPILTGKMVLDYTRTWLEFDPGGGVTQVWRFTAKADLSCPPGVVAPPCPAPSCIMPAGPHPTAFFYGYVDYSNCTSPVWDSSIVLYHAADRFIHIPGLSDKPGVFHPVDTYAIVAPHSAVQPFFPANAIAPVGPVVAEAVRDLFIPGIPPIFCICEDPIVQGVMVKLGAGCLNIPAVNPKQQTLRDFKGTTTCVSAAGVPGGWATLNLFPTLPWLHLVTTSIGSWGNPGVWPGAERVWVDEGLFVHQDPCVGDFIELKYGASTSGGFNALLPNPIPVSHFTDVADNYTAPLAGPYPVPILGSIMPTQHLIYANLP
jgi:hypothetical protein